MKSFAEYTGNKIVIEKKPLVYEASIMKPDYAVGHKFFYKGGISEMDKEGFKHGDIFTAVPPTKKAIFIGKEDGKLDKYLEKDKVVFHFKGGEGYKSTYFNHVKAGGDVPNGAQWLSLIHI